MRALRRARRIATVYFTVWTYLVAAPFVSAGFAIAAMRMKGEGRERARKLMAIIARSYRFAHGWMRFSRLVDLDPRDEISGLPDGPCVVVANHPTLTDVTAITALMGGACTIVKPELYHRRLLHRLLKSSGHICGPGAAFDQEKTRACIEESVSWLNDGFRLVVFPEGTRSVGGALGNFGRTSFEIACRAGVPVVALTVESDPPYLTKEVSMYRPPLEASTLRIRFLDVFEPGEHGNDSRALSNEVRQRYLEWAGPSPS